MGRACLDLYSNDVGVPFPGIRSFAAYLGGSPANIAVGASRLGLRAAMLTAVGDDPVGDFVLAALREDGVDVTCTVRKPGFRTGAALVAVEPPDRFPMVYYRDNPADIQLDLDDVVAAPIADSHVLQLAGTNLSREPSRSATVAAAEIARREGTRVVLDLDFRADQWDDPRRFGLAVRSLLPHVDVVLGTEPEINAAVLAERDGVTVADGQVSEARVDGDSERAVAALLALGPGLVVRKLGATGCAVHTAGCDGVRRRDVPGFPATICNVLGAGDAFAAGFLYGCARGWTSHQAARLANACGAFVVERHGCSASMPTLEQAEGLMLERGSHGTPAEGQASNAAGPGSGGY